VIDYDLLQLMPDEVTVELPADKDMYGAVIYDTPTTYQCRIEQSIRLVRDQDGRERVSNATVYLGTPVRIPLNVRLTLPDGSQPSVMGIEAVQDEDGSYTTKLFT
jgi:hypothetical protein